MKIVCAPDSFKGTMSAVEVANVIEQEVKRFLPDTEFIKLPIADGGEGSLEVIAKALKANIVNVPIEDANDKRIEAQIGIKNDIAIIEIAKAVGITICEKNPDYCHTYGVGEMVKYALDMGAKKIYFCLGGSVTNDGGTGMLRALGARFLDEHQEELFSTIDIISKTKEVELSGLDERIKETEIVCLCDVKAPYYGENGATHIFGAQKGVKKEQMQFFDDGLKNLNDIINRDYKIDINAIEGSGAAGGLGGSICGILGGTAKSGIDEILNLYNFDMLAKGADFVITGEGCTDFQSCQGKVIDGIGKRCESIGVAAYVISGSLAEGYDEIFKNGIKGAWSCVTHPMPLNEALENAEKNLVLAARNFIQIFL